MGRPRRRVIATVLLLVATACAEGDGPIAGLATPTTTAQPVAAVAERAPVVVPFEREPAPEVVLSNGERVALFEDFDHDNFSDSAVIDNPWLPMQPGMRMVFEGVTKEDGEVIPHQLIFVTTDLVKVIDGIPSLVRWDIDYSDGELVETEIAFYAQDDEGTVWRMGEYPEEWEEGEFLLAPAWIAGAEGARAGIAMPANPRVGASSFSQGWGPAVEFNDRAFIWEKATSTCVAFGCFSNVMVVDEFNDDEPGAHQLKYYAQGIGNVQVGWRGDDSSVEELELVESSRLSPEEMAKAREAAMLLDQRAYVLLEDLYGATSPAEPMDP